MSRPAEKPVALYKGLGSWRHPIAARSPEAQKFFDQGLALLYGFNRYEALRSFRKTLELDPYFPPPHLWLGWALQRSGADAAGIDAMRRSVSLAENAPLYLACLGYAYGVEGDIAAARRVLAELEDISTRRYVSAYDFALVHVGLEEIDEVFASLDRAVCERSTWLVTIKADSRFSTCAQDARSCI